jgi:tRNA nucleotidyltransferase/poly(A) polymerase
MRPFSTLPGELISLLRGLGESADQINARAYLVGAYPRSIITKEDCSDLEIVITGAVERFTTNFLNNYPMIKKKDLHEEGRYTFVSSPYSEGDFIKIARARKTEREDSGNVVTEAFSRGFSIDSLCINLSGKYFGKIYDPAGAFEDIENKVLRLLHRDIFEVEPFFIFKAIHYTAKYGLSWEPITETVWRNAIKKGLHNNVDEKERKLILKAIKKEKYGKSALKLLEDAKVLKPRGLWPWKIV